jgi:putative Ca2+/H+ antiporter (TMEM165/GDT1 family)
MGLTLPNYIPTYWIDIFAVLIFLIFGMKMLIDGLKMSQQMNLNKMAEVNKEINKEIFKENEILAQINKNENSDEIKNNMIKETLEVFVQTFTLVFLSELGDKSQISTIYLSANSDPMIIFSAVTTAQFLLTIIAVIGGTLISGKITERTLTIFAGIMFIAFGVISLYLTYINDFVIINKAWHSLVLNYQKNPHFQKIPDRYEIKNNFLQI